jgi:cholesterol transport system auxiliary component
MPSSRLIVSLAALAVATLPGCTAFNVLGGAAQPFDAYTLTPAKLATPVPATSRHILVEAATATGAIDTDRILVKPSPIQVQYLAGARWVDPVPELIQSLLTESLSATGAFRYVGSNTVGPFPDYTLLTQVLDFQAETTGDPDFPVEAVVSISIALVREEDGAIVSSRRFDAVRPSPNLDPSTVVGAFNAATDEVLEEAVAWMLSTFGLAPAA